MHAVMFIETFKKLVFELICNMLVRVVIVFDQASPPSGFEQKKKREKPLPPLL